MEQGLTRNQVIQELTRSPHRDLNQFLLVGNRAAVEDPEFFGHLIAWNHQKGEVRDAKVALPMIALGCEYTSAGNGVLVENALAHLADLNPRLLVRALEFRKNARAPKNLLQRFVHRYLADLEGDPRDWDNTALQHRDDLGRLYTWAHRATSEAAKQAWGWKRTDGTRPPRRGKFAIVATLGALPALEIAGLIDRYKLPWLVVRGALGARIKEPDVLMAVLSRMTAADIVTMSKTLVKWGVNDHAITRAAYEEALTKAAKPKRSKGTTLKASRAAKALKQVGEEKTAGKLEALQQKQLDHVRTIEGRWLVLADKSSSMSQAIDAGKRIAAVLGTLAKGTVHLVFFDSAPRPLGNVEGKSLQAIELATALMRASGNTSIGCGMQWALDHQILVDGIVVVSDGGENTAPWFHEAYQRYAAKMGTSPTVYFYHLNGDRDALSVNCARYGVELQTFDLVTTRPDDYSLPTLVQTMRVGRYELGDEVLATPLRTLDEALRRTIGQEVFRGQTIQVGTNAAAGGR